jgi:hypothetical protein
MVKKQKKWTPWYVPALSCKIQIYSNWMHFSPPFTQFK